MKKIFSVLLAGLIFLSMTGCEKEKPYVKELSEYQNENPKIESMLHVKNGKIVDENGEKKLLFGINLGNWLLMETWMNVIPEYTMDWAHYDTLEMLTEKFGEDKTNELMRVYQENFITAADIEHNVGHKQNHRQVHKCSHKEHNKAVINLLPQAGAGDLAGKFFNKPLEVVEGETFNGRNLEGNQNRPEVWPQPKDQKV